MQLKKKKEKCTMCLWCVDMIYLTTVVFDILNTLAIHFYFI